jgi:phosphodiesterase/alkaline phosphatase D-like protein
VVSAPSIARSILLFSAAMLALAIFAAPASADRTYQCQITGKSTPSATECNLSGNTVPGGSFHELHGLAVDGSDNLWVSDAFPGGAVDKFDSSGNFVLQSTGAPWTGSYIYGLGYDIAQNRVLVGDAQHDDLWTLKPDGSLDQDISGSDSTWGGGCCYPYPAADNSGGPATGTIYVASTIATVTRINADGTLAPFSFSASYISGGRLTGTPEHHFGAIRGAAVGPGGELFVMDENNKEIDTFESSGKFVGEPIRETPGGPFGRLDAIAVDPSSGDIFVADNLQHVIHEFESTGTWVADIAGTETPAGSFGSIEGLAVDSTGQLYVSDSANRVIDVFGAGIPLPKPTYGPVTDATPTSATFHATIDPNGGAPVSSCHFEFGTTSNYGSTAPCTPDPGASAPASNFVVPTDVEAGVSGLTAETTYHYRVVVGSANGTRKGGDRTFTPRAVSDLTTDTPSQVAQNSATLNGSFRGEGNDVHYYYDWGTGTSYGNRSAVPPGDDIGSPSGPGRTSIPFDLSGLAPETTYHYRVVATSSFGTSFGGDRELTTPPAIAGLTTGSASDFVPGGATLSGHYTGVGKDTHYYFQYGKTNEYGQTTDVPPGSEAGSGSGVQEVKAFAGGLLPSRVYHYRVVASNEYGTTYGADQTFESIPPALPTVVAGNASEVTPSSAALGAEVRPGFGPTVVRFEYGLSAAYETRTFPSDPLASDDSAHPVTTTITTLVPRTTYHFRVVATNFSGTTYGPDQTFDTPDAPEVTIESPGVVTPTTAVLQAGIRPGFRPSTYHFEYGLTGLYGARTPESSAPGSDDSAHQVMAPIAGLTPATTYHYRVVATNEFGTKVGPDMTVTTTQVVTPGPVQRPAGCKKGFVKKRGKCVKKKSNVHTHHKRGQHRG